MTHCRPEVVPQTRSWRTCLGLLCILVTCTLWGLSPAYAQECGVIYITPTGASTGAPGTVGTRANPASLVYGLQLASAQNGYLKLAVGSYTIDNPLTLKDSIVIEGGYLPVQNWAKTNEDSTVIRRSALNPQTNPSRLVAFQGAGRRTFRIQELRIAVASGTASGMSVYGIHLDNCRNYTINRVQIFMGNGVPGVDGTAGVAGASGAPGTNGGLGTQFTTSSIPGLNTQPVGDPITPPYVIDGGTGGSSWSGGATAGGNGGAGGVRGTSTDCNPLPAPFGSGCDVCEPTQTSAGNGQNGLPGAGTAAGAGGAGKLGLIYCDGNGTNQTDIFNYLNSCGATDQARFWGNPGQPGANGAAGAQGIDAPVVHNVFYIPGDGTDGADGQNGAGGGGGGGGSAIGGIPRLTLLPNVNSAGAGGGGGGEGGQRGTAGTKGTGGGGSFCIYLWQNGPNGVIKDCVLRPGNGGPGGRGGAGGAGGVGGNGGLGGNDANLGVTNPGSGCRSGAGGNGGKGGNGGNGGRGGNGSNGPSVGVFQSQGSQQAIVFSQFNNQEPKVTVQTNGCTNVTATVSTTSTGNVVNWFLGGVPQAGTGTTVTTDYPTSGFKNLAINIDGVPFNLGDFVYVYREFVQPKITSSAQTICAGQAVTLSTTASDAFTYSWSIPGGSITTSTQQNPGTVTFANPGTYNITLQTTSCCGTSRRDTFKLNVVGTFTVDLPPSDTVCRFGPRPVLVPQALPGASISWTYNGAPLNPAPANPFSVTTNLAGTYGVTVSYQGGCSASDTFRLSLTDTLIVNLGPDVVLCTGDLPPLLNAGNPGASIQWLRNGNPAGTGQFFQTVTPGTYRAIVNDGLGCFGSDQMVLRSSAPTLELGRDRAYCPGASIDTLDAGNPGASYQWTIDGVPVSTSRRIPLDVGGRYRVVVTDPLGCTVRDSLQVTLGASLTAAFNAPATVQVNTPVNFVDQSTPTPLWWFWNFGDGDTLSAQSPTHTFTTPGLKPVFLIISNGFCQDTAELTINVLLDCGTDKPVPGFTFTPADSLDLRFSGTAQFTNTTTNGQTYEWTVDNGQQSTVTNPVFTFSQPGTYTVKLVARNFNCSDSITRTVRVVQSVPQSRNGNLGQGLTYTLFPNPASTTLYLEIAAPGVIAPLNLTLTDVTGKVVHYRELPSQGLSQLRVQLPVQELPAGVYLLELRTAEGAAAERILIQR